MPRTATEAIARAKRDYPGMEPEVALEFLNDVLRDLAVFGQFQLGSEDVSTVAAGTREYALSTSSPLGNVQRITWHLSSTDRKELIQVSHDWLDQNVTNWRELTASTDRGTPEYAYVYVKSDGLRYVGFHPIPDESVSGGYPKATLYGSIFSEVTGDDSLPDAIPSLEVFRAGINRLWARGQDVDRAAHWDSLYYFERSAAVIALKNALQHSNSSVQPRHTENTCVV